MIRGASWARNHAAPITPIRYVTAKATGIRLVIAAVSAGDRPSRAIASLAVPIVADSVRAPAMTPAAVPAS
jgi:hypothetical protein